MGDARFLTAEWRHLAMLNYAVDPSWLQPWVPAGTELDSFNQRTYVSLVGFRFLDTRLLGLPVPFHRDFEEVNLRFYVRRHDAGTVKRGVVFIKEIVPRFAIAAIARIAYNENYVRLPMSHAITTETGIEVQYSWRTAGRWASLHASATGDPTVPPSDSEDSFIAEHYWGYAKQRDGSTVEYEVVHPPWRVWRAETAKFEGDVSQLYGSRMAEVLQRPPDSAFIAEGSPVAVFRGRPLAQ